MDTNKTILDEFGSLISTNVFDNQYKFILNKLSDLEQTEEYKNLFKAMNFQQKQEIELYTKEVLKGALFDFLKIFEENEQFKIIYEGLDGKQVNLLEISDMLKAELIIENGWIERFSQEIGQE